MKKKSSGASPATMNSTVPAPTYPTDLAADTAAAPIADRCAAVSSGDGASSMIFWCRRCSEHSRSPRWITPPCASASTWISMCRGFGRYRSTSSVPSPKAATAVRRADSSAAGISARDETTRMPFPPPPADGLMRTGNHRSFRLLMSSSSGIPAAPAPGTTGTPAADTTALAAILSPIARIAAGGGPTNTSPASRQACANRAFSARNP